MRAVKNFFRESKRIENQNKLKLNNSSKNSSAKTVIPQNDTTRMKRKTNINKQKTLLL